MRVTTLPRFHSNGKLPAQNSDSNSTDLQLCCTTRMQYTVVTHLPLYNWQLLGNGPDGPKHVAD
jgi:hypothetical protein